MSKLLTIVVPTYNMEAYLNRCLDSLLVSDEQMQLLEVLVINDGSKDNSSAIAHEYEEKYPNTFRVIDKENGNYGSCINRGLKEATGKYIKVLDADDWFDTEALEAYIGELSSTDVDMIITPYWIVDENGNKQKEMVFDLEYEKVFSFQSYTNPAVYFAMHALTYKTDMLRSINYTQTEGISYTDTEWVFYPQHAVDTCVYLPYNLYRYVVGREGQTMDPKVIAKSVGQYDKLIRSMIAFADNLSKEAKQLYTYQRLSAQIEHLSLGVYNTSLVKQQQANFDNDLLQSFDDMLRTSRPDIWKAANKLVLKKRIPLHYVAYWRKHRKRFPIDIFRNIFRKLRYK